jgi:succinate-semialdehyde dehydrogenase/glutarate-semialdehyde dehydrogenase
LFIRGCWLPAASGGSISVLNPATEEVLARVADADEADGVAAVNAAVDAQRGWAATPAGRRADILDDVYRAILSRRDEFAALIAAEMGKPRDEAQGEVDYGAGFFRWFAESARRLHLDGQFGIEPGGQYRIAVSKRPVGPSLLITPLELPVGHECAKNCPRTRGGMHHHPQTG